jgi:enediyne biosynthesis protein E4
MKPPPERRSENAAIPITYKQAGTRVVARYGTRRQAQEVTAQSSFYSANDRRLHFGLGAETAADLTIRWTNGTTETIPHVAADQLLTIREGAGIIGKQKFR